MSSSFSDFKERLPKHQSTIAEHLPNPSIAGQESSKFVKHLFGLNSNLEKMGVDPLYRDEIAIQMLEIWCAGSQKYLENSDDGVLCDDAIAKTKRNRHEEDHGDD